MNTHYLVAAAAAFLIGTARLTRAGPLYEDDDGDLDFGARERPLQRATSYVDALIPLEFQVGIQLWQTCTMIYTLLRPVGRRFCGEFVRSCEIVT